MPGFVDCHIHFPQTEVIAAYGEQLLEWLNKYTFPAEGKFKDKTHAKTMAEQFLNELLRAGTTTALGFWHSAINSQWMLFLRPVKNAICA